MRGTLSLQKSIKKIIDENCEKKMFIDCFGESGESEIAENSTYIAQLTLEDEEFMSKLNEAIEESIRIMMLRK